MIILYELVDFIKAIRIKMFALYAEVSLDRFAQRAHLKVKRIPCLSRSTKKYSFLSFQISNIPLSLSFLEKIPLSSENH